MKVQVKLDKPAAGVLDGFFNHVFNTGSSVTFTIEFDSTLFYPSDENEVIEPTVLVFPKKALIQIK